MPSPKPPCELCGETLYRPSGMHGCVCGGEHDLCVTCCVRHELTSVEEMVKCPVGRLLVCPDQVRVAKELMGERVPDRFDAWTNRRWL